MPSKGAAALAKICEKDDRGQVGVASRLGEHQSMISRWITEERKPNAENRKKLEDELGIDWRAWDESADAERAAP